MGAFCREFPTNLAPQYRIGSFVGRGGGGGGGVQGTELVSLQDGNVGMGTWERLGSPGKRGCRRVLVPMVEGMRGRSLVRSGKNGLGGGRGTIGKRKGGVGEVAVPKEKGAWECRRVVGGSWRSLGKKDRVGAMHICQ